MELDISVATSLGAAASDSDDLTLLSILHLFRILVPKYKPGTTSFIGANDAQHLAFSTIAFAGESGQIEDLADFHQQIHIKRPILKVIQFSSL